MSLDEGQATYIMTYDTTTKGLYIHIQLESELENKGQIFLFQDIIDNRLIKGYN